MIEECIAQSEDGDWIALPRSIPRRSIIPGLYADAYDQDWTFRELLQTTRIRVGYVRPWRPGDEGEEGWHLECQREDEGAFEVWIVTR